MEMFPQTNPALLWQQSEQRLADNTGVFKTNSVSKWNTPHCFSIHANHHSVLVLFVKEATGPNMECKRLGNEGEYNQIAVCVCHTAGNRPFMTQNESHD
eukprot:1415364-Amphidinium_carterae.1